MKRLRSAMLPLEAVPPGDEIYGLAQVIEAACEALSHAVRGKAAADNYILSGSLKDVVLREPGEARNVETRLRDIVLLWAEKAEGISINEALELVSRMKSRLEVLARGDGKIRGNADEGSRNRSELRG